ncbi:neurabin [Paragonimus westermani]|uniref:Neurabin n=1 Tax=Paragonimus westermani TaxID=34504 RepID=A0A5J4NWM9_9TREM|nr:neurabin [Paragonimus westermani]
MFDKLFPSFQIYSTHSTLEYNRRNDEIDPLAASAEYELEKHLEEMEMVNVDLQKGPQGLGISILGLGVDNVGGDQKLGIFIKALTPGGAAEANGQIQVYDQIVTVNGVSLVGVSQQFAAQTLRNTHDVVHFVLAREHDPANSRVAQLLAEQEDESRPSNPALPSAAEWKRASTDLGDSLVRDDSLETLHKLLADAEQAVHEAVDSFSEDELGPEEEEDEELEIVDTSPIDRLGQNSDWIDCGVSERITSIESHQQNTSDLSGPRSALKGTATAASTKRRQDAILHLIRLVEQRAKTASSSDLPSVSQSADNGVDNVRWILASDLYDCHTQLIKLQTQLRSLEQRLTAQEAAADEAIERLCRQCRHVELELNESRERLKQYIQHQTQQQQPQSPSLTKQIPSKNPHENGLSVSPGTSSNSVPTSSLSNELVPLLNPSIWSSNFVSSDPGTLTVHMQDSSCGDHWLAVHSSSKTTTDSFQSGLSPTHPVVCVHSEEATTVTTCSDSPIRQHSRWSQDRTRLISSGGLAQRRPPTRITINPPPSLVPNAEALLSQFT